MYLISELANVGRFGKLSNYNRPTERVKAAYNFYPPNTYLEGSKKKIKRFSEICKLNENLITAYTISNHNDIDKDDLLVSLSCHNV